MDDDSLPAGLPRQSIHQLDRIEDATARHPHAAQIER